MSERLPLQMLAGLLAGLALGTAAHALFAGSPAVDAVVRYAVEPAGQIFLRLLFVLVIPLIVSALALSIADLGDLRRVGRIGLRTLAYTAAVSAIAVAIGVFLVNAIEPGAGLDPALRARLGEGAKLPAAAISAVSSGVDFLIDLVPANSLKAMADGDMLAVMVFAILLGIGLATAPGEPPRRLVDTLRGLSDVTMHLLGLVIRIA